MTACRRPLCLAWAGLLLAVAPASAQPARAPRQKKLVESVGPDAIVRLANQLQTLQDAERDPRFQDALRRIQQMSPNLSPEQLQMAKELLHQNPEYQNLDKLRELANGLGGQGMLNGLPGFDPKNLPGGLPPGNGQFPKRPANPHQTGSLRGGDDPFSPRPDQSERGQDGGNFLRPRPIPDEMEHPPTLAPRGFDAAIDPEQLARRQQQFEAMKNFWEQNVGPLHDTPSVRELMKEMLLGNSNSTAGTKTLGDLVDAMERNDGPELRHWLKDAGLSDWKLPNLGLGSGKRNRDFNAMWSPPAPPSGNSSWPRFGSAGDSWLPVILFGLIAAGALVLWWLWPKLTAAREDGPRPLPGLGPWPVDPRVIADRDALVRAFEYLSVLLCGQGVKTWNHVVIAAALQKIVPQAEALAEPLAKLYALARYTPANEPLPPTAITEAREYLCELAGVSAV